MVSGVEVPSWVGRDLRVGCVVVCEREGGEERKKREKERISLYSTLPIP